MAGDSRAELFGLKTWLSIGMALMTVLVVAVAAGVVSQNSPGQAVDPTGQATSSTGATESARPTAPPITRPDWSVVLSVGPAEKAGTGLVIRASARIRRPPEPRRSFWVVSEVHDDTHVEYWPERRLPAEPGTVPFTFVLPPGADTSVLRTARVYEVPPSIDKLYSEILRAPPEERTPDLEAPCRCPASDEVTLDFGP